MGNEALSAETTPRPVRSTTVRSSNHRSSRRFGASTGASSSRCRSRSWSGTSPTSCSRSRPTSWRRGYAATSRRPAARPRPGRHHVRDHDVVRLVRQPHARPSAADIRDDLERRRATRERLLLRPLGRHDGREQPHPEHLDLRGLRRGDAVHRDPREPQQQDRGRLLRGRRARSPGRRTASRSRATTCPRHRSSASAARSRSTATTGSSTRSASWSPGSSPCCWSPSCMRNTGKFTMADVLSFRLKQGPVRMAAAITTLAVCFFYLLAQMAGAGGLVSLLLGIGPDRSVDRGRRGRRAHDPLRARRRDEGHHLGADLKAFLLIGGAAVMTVWVLALNGFSSRTCSTTRSRLRHAIRRRDPRSGPAVRRTDRVGRLHLPLARAGSGYRRPAARADALLHGSDREGSPSLGGVGASGSSASSTCSPSCSATAPRRWSAPRTSCGARWRELRGSAARVRARRTGAARLHLGGRVRDDPRGRGRTHDHRGGVVRARHLCERREEGQARPDGEVKVARRTVIVIGVLAIIGGIGVNGRTRLPRGTRVRGRGIRKAGDHAREQRGAIVNMSSLSGKVGLVGQTNYSAAKAGIVGMTKAAAKELAHLGVRVNAIAPGLIRSAMTEAMPQHIWDQKVAEVPMGRARRSRARSPAWRCSWRPICPPT